MTTNIRINLTKIGLFCAFVILNIACKEHDKIQAYYYEVYETLDSVPQHYQAIKIIDRNGIREQITYRYSDINKTLTGKSIEYYKLCGKDLLKLRNMNDSGKLFLSTRHKDSCIICRTGNELYDNVAAVTHCFRGKKRVKLSDNKSISSYEFTKEVGFGIDHEICTVLYDQSYVPIKIVNIDGLTYIDTINRISSIPSEFDSLLNTEEDWVKNK